MNTKKWLLLVLCVSMVFLCVGCEEANLFPQNRELVIINGTTDVQIFEIGIEALPFGQRAIDSSYSFRFIGSDIMDSDEQFAIVLSPYVYRIAVNIRYANDETDELRSSRRVTIDLPAKSSQATYITLVNSVDASIPDHALEVTGEHVAYQIPILA
ncbi:MAG: hypothetical protein EOM68_21250 [Spirochaetia bacterium]|nr:hypothetical protein [Spirochaetia bacterium]